MFQTLVTLLMAALAAVALLVGLWAWQTPVPIQTTPRLPLPEFQGLAAPTPLGPRQPSAVEAAVQPDRPRTDDCLVEIVGHGITIPGAVVGILDAATGAHLAHTTLASQKLPHEVRFANVPEGEHWAVLARNESELRYAYLNRSRLRPRGKASDHRTATLRGQVHDLLVELKDPTRLRQNESDAVSRGGPVILRRPDDPHWRYREPKATNDSAWLLLTDDAGQIRLRQLGAGRYLLCVEGFQRAGGAAATGLLPEWLPVTMDRDRVVTLTGSVR